MPLGAARLNTLSRYVAVAGPAANGSMLFDGTGDYLSVTSTSFQFGTGDFTIECWARSSVVGNNGVFHLAASAFPASASGMALAFYGSKVWGWQLYAGSQNTNATDEGNDLFDTNANVWYHLAYVRSSTTVTLYVNGAKHIEFTGVTDDFSTTDSLVIGGYFNTSFLMNGNIDNFRVSNTARYTANFTPSTEPFTSDVNTVLLINADGASDGSTTFTDESSNELTVTANGDAQIDTDVIIDDLVRPVRSMRPVNGTTFSSGVKKFGTYSASFDATDDYLVLSAGSGDFSGDFTIECWYYPTSVASNDKIFDLRGIHSAHTGADTVIALGSTLLIDQNSSDFRVFIDGADRSSAGGGTFTVNTWHHVAVQRKSGTINAWVNGTRYVNYSGSDDYTGVFAVNQPIGVNISTSGDASYLEGYMDEIRISTVARYNNGTTITVPTAAFTNDADTYALFHMENNFEDDNS
jgi:hypothetical protein